MRSIDFKSISGLLSIGENVPDWDQKASELLFSKGPGVEWAAVFSAVFWPKFIAYEKFVFMEEQFDEDWIHELRHGRRIADELLESAVNTVLIDDLFGPESRETKQSVLEFVGSTLAESSRAAASAQFREITFKSRFAYLGVDRSEASVTVIPETANFGDLRPDDYVVTK